jgi:hypothetical protein
VFDRKGNILDGQNRLKGVVIANKPTDFIVVEGHNPDIFPYLDSTLKKRNTVDALEIAAPATKYKSSVSSAIRLITAIKDRTLNVNLSTSKVEFSPADILREHTNYPDLEYSLSWGSKMKSFLNPSVTGSTHYLFSQACGKAKADEFYSKLLSGSNLTEGDPILVLSRRLSQEIKKKSKMNKNYVVGLIIKGWNKWIAGEKISNIGGFHNVSKVPDIIGLSYE